MRTSTWARADVIASCARSTKACALSTASLNSRPCSSATMTWARRQARSAAATVATSTASSARPTFSSMSPSNASTAFAPFWASPFETLALASSSESCLRTALRRGTSSFSPAGTLGSCFKRRDAVWISLVSDLCKRAAELTFSFKKFRQSSIPCASAPSRNTTSEVSSACLAPSSASATFSLRSSNRSSGDPKLSKFKPASASSFSSSLPAPLVNSAAHPSSASPAFLLIQTSRRLAVASLRSWSSPNSLSAMARASGANARASRNPTVTLALARFKSSRALPTASGAVMASAAISACVVSSTASGSATSNARESCSSAIRPSMTLSRSCAWSRCFEMEPDNTWSLSSMMVSSASASLEAFWRFAALVWRAIVALPSSVAAALEVSKAHAARTPSSRTSGLSRTFVAVLMASSA
mmetsp:Transcript_84200/g.234844  ORF Transcript_84200/g.234844 Transcript_84200/m.234844 type:complete len:415 (-) Transcript_84200:965-2209(-)